MFVRKKRNASGSTSVQIVDKRTGSYRIVKTIGHATDVHQLEELVAQARADIPELLRQTAINFQTGDDSYFLKSVRQSIEGLQLLGPELVLGKIFDSIGFNAVKEKLFRYLTITRLVYPVSKLKMTEYLQRYNGEHIDVDRVYRSLDRINKNHKEDIQRISYNHTKEILGGKLAAVFYDVTTLYFEAEDEDDLRKIGYSKDGKSQQPQIVLGLLVSTSGYPLAYDIFEGNKFEGHTMIPILDAFKTKYDVGQLTVIADAGLLSTKNINELKERKYEFILGARIKNESDSVKNTILKLKLQSRDGNVGAIDKTDGTRLIISYTSSRAKKDAHNRKRGLQKLETALDKGKLTKDHLNNRGFNKYLNLVGEVKIEINYIKYNTDAQWDGLKGYITNTTLNNAEVIENYSHLWTIEKAFRISKTDLRIRPIYHHLKGRIEAHICIAFSAYKLYKELERQLPLRGLTISPIRAIDIIRSIFGLQIRLPAAQTVETLLIATQPEQKELLDAFEIEFGCPNA